MFANILRKLAKESARYHYNPKSVRLVSRVGKVQNSREPFVCFTTLGTFSAVSKKHLLNCSHTFLGKNKLTTI